MRIEDINRDREKFLHSILTSLEPELRKIGLILINVNITDITDESGYIEAIGRKAAAMAIQQAKIDVAEQERKGQTGIAEAERERAISVANATKAREIGTREATREQAVRVAQLDKEAAVGQKTALLEQEALIKEAQRQQAIRIAELDRDQKVGEQKAGFEREALVAEAEKDKRVRQAEANAKATAGEASAQAQVFTAQADMQVRKAEAYQLAETKKREAEASVQEAQNRAMAKAALADAERIEAEAQAAAVYAKLEAEARGQYEILAKKGEGLKKIIEACGSSQAAFQMLMLEHLDALAHASAQAISNIKFDKVVVWDGGGANGHGSGTTQFLHNMAKVMPPMLQVMKDIGGVEVPEFLARLQADAATKAPNANGHAAEPAAKG
jgi:flotillin